MSKSKYNYKVYNGKALKKMLENSRIYFLAVVFSIGIVIGAAAINSSSLIAEKTAILIDSYTLIRSGQGIIENFCNSFFVSCLFIAAGLFLGFSLLGYPFLLWLPFLRGVGLGTVCGYLYDAYKLTGLGYSILTVYPGAIVSTFAFILACNDSCEYSKNAYAKSIRGRGQFEKDETKVYLIRQLIFLGICAASAIIDAFSSAAFSRFFEI